MKEYTDPTIATLGTVAELTATVEPDKCGGSGDAYLPQQLSEEFGTPHCE
jgi:hypothetical protein